MNINYRTIIITLIGSLLIAMPIGITIVKGGIKKSDVAINPLIKSVAASPQPETKTPPIEESKVESPPVIQEAPTTTVSPPAYIDGNCESYRPLVQKYFGNATNAAMITMLHESGCTSWKVSNTNDYGLFQLNGLDIREPEANVKYAYEHKFLIPRRGSKPNFSAWYAVCTPNLVPKYAGIWCN